MAKKLTIKHPIAMADVPKPDPNAFVMPKIGELLPREGFLLVKPIEIVEKSSSGIILIEEVPKERPNVGKVVVTNAEAFEEDDVIIYAKYAGHDLMLEGSRHVVLKQEDILLTTVRKK